MIASQKKSNGEQSDHRSNRRKSEKCKFVAAARRKNPTRQSKKPGYQVEVVVNETTTEMFADTGADISVMSAKKVEQLGLTLNKT